MTKISVIIPCFNEERRVENCYDQLFDFFVPIEHYTIEFVFVDDGSTDDTLRLLQDIQKEYHIKYCGTPLEKYQSVKIISYQQNKGKGYAVRQGLLNSKYVTKVVLDCDLSIHPRELRKINFGGKWHIIKGRRRFINEPLLRRILSWGWHQYIRFYTGLDYDTQSPFTVLRLPRNFYAKRLSVDGFCYDIEILLSARHKKYRIEELPVDYLYKKGSKVTFKKTLLMLEEIQKIKDSI